MSNFILFDIINALYRKEKKYFEIDTNICIMLNKWLSYDRNNLPYIFRALNYIWYLTPKHYYYLLFCIIPQSEVPFLRKSVKEKEKKENVLYEKIRDVLNWSQKELQSSESILDSVIDAKYWKKELGVK